MTSLRRTLAVRTLRRKTQGEHCCVDNGYINLLPSTGSSVSSDDEFTNRALYSEVRRRMKSGSDSSSTDDDFTFEEIHYGNILSRRTRRRRLRGKFCSPRKYCSSLSSPSSMSSSSTPEKTKNIGAAIYYDYYDNTEQTEPATDPSRPTNVPGNMEPNKGQVKLVICGSPQKITVTLIEMQLPAYHPTSSQVCLKIHLIPDDNSSSQARFRTKILPAKVDSATVFHETFTFDLESSYNAKRILISAWARNTNHGQRPFFLGCMSFGLRKLIENEEIVQGSYYLLSETLGRKKHLAAKSIADKRRSMNVNTHHHKEPSQFMRNSIKRSTYTTRRDAIYYKNINIDLSNERNPGFVLCQHSPEIVSVCNHSVAFLAGLHAGDLIVKVNQQLVRTIGQDVLCSIIRNCSGTLQLLIRRTKESSSLYASAPQHCDKSNRKRRSQHFIEEDQTTKRRRSHRTNSNPSCYSANDNNGDYPQYEDDVFESESSCESWKNSQSNETKRNPAIYYDLNTTPSFVDPVEVKAVQTKAARILTQKVTKKTTQKPLHASKLTTTEDYPSYYTDNEPNYQRTNDSKPISRCDKPKTPAIYYDINQPLATVDEQSMSSDSGISEDNYTSLCRNKPQDNSETSSKQNNLTSKKENKLKFLSRVYSRDFRKSTYKKNNKVNLSQVLQSRKATLSFRLFLQKEYSDENLDFWLECESFKSLKQRKQEKQAVKIFKKYLETGAPFEVNITAEIRSTVAEKLSNPPNNIFNEAQSHIHRLMENDSFCRYLESHN